MKFFRSRRKQTTTAAATAAAKVTSNHFRPLDVLLRACAWISEMSSRDLASYCDLATCDETGLITFGNDYVTIVQVHGLRRMAGISSVQASAARLRQALSGLFDEPGHAMQFCYATDPDASRFIRKNLGERRTIARALHADFEDILSERERVLTPFMRHERVWLALWSRPGRMSKPEAAASKSRRDRLLASLPDLGDGQNPLLGSAELATIHGAFVAHVVQAFRSEDVIVEPLSPDAGLRAIREEIYPETLGSGWTPVTPKDAPPSTIPDDDMPDDVSDALWPPLREQIFTQDAITPDFTTVRLGCADWSPVDLTRVSENVRPFIELSSSLAAYRMPWRMCATIEGVPSHYMSWKKEVATLLRFGTNLAVHDAFEELAARRAKREAIVKLRVSFATSAPAEDREKLRARASRLEQGINGWGRAKASRMCGDPLSGTLSSVPGLALASTAPPTAAPLDEALVMTPWARPATPWADGAALLRANDGTIVPYDPAGRGRVATLDLFVAPSRRGKSMLANALLLATVLSSASMTDLGPRLPLIGKLDIGDAASGFIDMVRNGLRPEDRHQALYLPFQFIAEHAYNIFDTEACCRTPLSYHLAFLRNFLGQICQPSANDAFEGMDQIIDDAISGVYALFSDKGPTVRPKMYRATDNLSVDAALASYGIDADDQTTWWEVADAFAAQGDMRLARVATQHAVPVMGDLLDAILEGFVADNFRSHTPTSGGETGLEIFRRYITTFIQRFPTLNAPTRLDLGDARIVALDINRVAPEGKGANEDQTSLMYLLGFHIVARNFFLDPEEAEKVPEHVRAVHRERFREFRESFKRLECDEFQRTIRAPFIRQMFEEAARRAAKLGVRLGLTSQKITDFGEYLTQHSTARFILGAANPEEADELAEICGLSPAAHEIVRASLNGPRPDGTGAPLILQIKVGDELFEMFVLNMLGPVELWALSTHPDDAALRRRLYDALGSTEGRRRLSLVFPKGSAAPEIERRKDARIRQGLDAQIALGGVITEIANEIRDATGLGAVVRAAA